MKKAAPDTLTDAPPADIAASAEAGEAQRQVAVDRTRWRKGEARLQHIVEAAARDYDAPIAVISIIDRRREYFAARTGTDLTEAPREDALCLQAIKRPGEPTVATDALTDRRFAGNPYVTGAPHVRFYAAVPLLDRAGYALGALCVIDTEPRATAPSMFNLIRLGREAERIIDR